MPRILRTGICLFALAAGFAACGQGEGGRCQIDSDCASGLRCLGVTNGNGSCGKREDVGPDAATPDDALADLASDHAMTDASDVQADGPGGQDDVGTQTDSKVLDVDVSRVDAESVDAGGID